MSVAGKRGDRRGGGMSGATEARERLPFVASVLGADYFLWSTSFVATKLALGDVPPLMLMAMRFVAAACVLGALVGFFGVFGDLRRRTSGGWRWAACSE